MMVVDGVEMLDVREAAAVVGRTPETLRRWIWAGKLAARKHGNRLLVARDDLDALMASAKRGPVTLAQWMKLVDDRVPSGKSPSAADLVLADRYQRDEPRARR
jgi:excisionase family DNA binding protein